VILLTEKRFTAAMSMKPAFAGFEGGQNDPENVGICGSPQSIFTFFSFCGNLS
jgi:hypothetical protein